MTTQKKKKKKRTAPRLKTKRTAVPRRKADKAAGADGHFNSIAELEARQRELEAELENVRMAKKVAPAADEVNEKLGLLHRAADLMEKSRIEDYMLLVNKPMRLIWVNLLAGLSRGVGFFFGTVLLSFVLLYLLGKFLGFIYEDVGGLPWIGGQLQEFIAWMQAIIQQAEQAKPSTTPMPESVATPGPDQ